MRGIYLIPGQAMLKALNQLGYVDTYHGFSTAFENLNDSEMWLNATCAKYDGRGKPFGRAELDGLLGHCQAVTDMPAYCFSSELIEANPEAKAILTIRDIDKWYNPAILRASGRILNALQALARSLFRFGRPVFTHVFENMNEGFEQSGRRRFQEHYELIRSIVPQARLLEYRISEGWGPLCKFLGPSVEFPNGNSKANLDRRIKAWGCDEWKRIKGLGLRFALLLVLGIRARTFLTWKAG